MLQVSAGSEEPRGVLALLSVAFAAHAVVALIATALAGVAFQGSLEGVGTSLTDPYLLRAAAFYVVAAGLLGALTARQCRSPLTVSRVGRAIGVGVLVHPLAFTLFALSARVVPFAGVEVVGSVLEDLRSALVFSVGAILFGAWIAIPAAWLAGEFVFYRSQARPAGGELSAR